MTAIRFNVSRCCCDDESRTLAVAIDRLAFVPYSNVAGPPYKVVNAFGELARPRVEDICTSLSSRLSFQQAFGIYPWYSYAPGNFQNGFQPIYTFEGWVRRNLILQFEGGVVPSLPNPTKSLPKYPSSVTLNINLYNTSVIPQGSQTDVYDLNIRPFWYPNQVETSVLLSDARSPNPLTDYQWSSTAVLAGSGAGLPTESIGSTAIANNVPSAPMWYTVNVDITTQYLEATQWWRDTARPNHQIVTFVMYTNLVQPTSADRVKLTDFWGNLKPLQWQVGTNPTSGMFPANEKFPTLTFT